MYTVPVPTVPPSAHLSRRSTTPKAADTHSEKSLSEGLVPCHDVEMVRIL